MGSLIHKKLFKEQYCKKCGDRYIDKTHKLLKWCKPCQINNLKANFTNWTSGKEEIDEFIQEMQLKIESYDDIIFEWIPYDQFSNDIKAYEDDFVTIYSAVLKDGPLYYSDITKKYERHSNVTVFLESFNNVQNLVNKFLSEV